MARQDLIPHAINGLSTSQRKIDRERDEVGRMLRALRNAHLFLQNQRRVSEKTLEGRPPRVAERFSALYPEQFNPDLNGTRLGRG